MSAALTEALSSFESFVSGNILVWLLLGTGLYLTVRTRAVQMRLFVRALRLVAHSRHQRGSLSSFQAFVIGLGGRVGTGNIAGVALAVTLGGPGALLWMWVVAILGMATSFAESTLAQVFKVRNADGIFRGGPAYYMQRGIGRGALGRRMGVVFAVMLVFSYGLIFPMVQSNTIAVTLSEAHGASTSVTAIVLMALTAPILLAGMRMVAKVTEWLVPLMALAYLVVVLVVIVVSIDRVPGAFSDIFAGAFNLRSGLAGTSGGFFATFLNGTKRGLFSNEAGQGTAPNAAATATVAHPVQQGLIQSLGVFIDTIVVCTATAFVILISGPEVWGADGANPSNLTIMAVSHELGGWTILPIAVLIFVLAYSSIIAAYVYSDTNVSFLTGGKTWATWAVRVVSVVSATAGAVLSLDVVWNAVDIAMAVMTVTNLAALILLSKWGVGALRDWETQRRAGVEEPVFVGHDNPHLPADVPGDVWN